MIRAWLSTARRRAPSVPIKPVDPAVFLGAQLDVRDAQIEGLRDALAEALKERDEERAARARDVARLQAELARYVAADLMRAGPIEYMRRPERERDHSSALEPTVVLRADQLQRPAAPTEQYRRPR